MPHPLDSVATTRRILHCTQHDVLTSGYSMKGVVSTALLRNGGGQSRNVHRAARDVASSILLPALQPPSSVLDCIRDEILPQLGFLRWLVSWWEANSAGRRETVVVAGTGGSDIGLLLLPPPTKQDVLGLPPTLHFRQLFRLPTGATLLGTFDGYLRHELPPLLPALSPPLLPSSLSVSLSLSSPLFPSPLSKQVLKLNCVFDGEADQKHKIRFFLLCVLWCGGGVWRRAPRTTLNGSGRFPAVPRRFSPKAGSTRSSFDLRKCYLQLLNFRGSPKAEPTRSALTSENVNIDS